MTPFGNRIRELRESQGLLQRQLAAGLEIDTPMYSKIERGERRAKREQVAIIANMLGADYSGLFILWLADHIFELVQNEEFAIDALNKTQEIIKSYEKID